MSDNIRLRVAPSPTGFPHVGTAFQALFDYVFAKKNNGRFIVRIEDTDQKRFVPEAEAVIFESLTWLGLIPDESPIHGGSVGPYRQSERLDTYKKYARELLDKDHAYYCFCSAERLEEMRKAQEANHQPPMYDRHCRSIPAAEAQKRIEKGEDAVIRMKMPDNETIIVQDLLRGVVSFDSNLLDDQILMKSDGFPTYHLAVVVDDHLMEITHAVRGEEWLPSAPKHVVLYRYFGWKEPKWVHTPILRNADHSKLSKRHGHTSLYWYRAQGYLPEALLNFLSYLVWSHPENKEIYSLDEMIQYFDFTAMRYMAPVFDLTKLDWINGNWIRGLSVKELCDRIGVWAIWVKDNSQEGFEFLSSDGQIVLEWIKKDSEFFGKTVALAQERLKKISEIKEAIEFYYEDALSYDREDLLQGHSVEEVQNVLSKADKMLGALPVGDHDVWDKGIRGLADELGWKHKDLFMILRSAITARKATPPLFDVMEVLGCNTVEKRIQAAIDYVKK